MYVCTYLAVLEQQLRDARLAERGGGVQRGLLHVINKIRICSRLRHQQTNNKEYIILREKPQHNIHKDR